MVLLKISILYTLIKPNKFFFFFPECPVSSAATVFVPLGSLVSTHPTQHAARPHLSTGLLPHSGLQYPQPPRNPFRIPPGAVSSGKKSHCQTLAVCSSHCKKKKKKNVKNVSSHSGPCARSHVRCPPLGEPRSAPASHAAAATAGPRLGAPAPAAWTARSTPALLHRTSAR